MAAKLSTTVLVSPAAARANASASTGAANAVTSPSMSMIRTVGAASRTDISTLASAIACPLSAGHRGRLVLEYPHEVAQSGDREDLPVVVAEAECPHRARQRPRPRQRPDHEGDPRRVDVPDIGEIECDRAAAGVERLPEGGAQFRLRCSVEQS